jgi:hypothetical protein
MPGAAAASTRSEQARRLDARCAARCARCATPGTACSAAGGAAGRASGGAGTGAEASGAAASSAVVVPKYMGARGSMLPRAEEGKACCYARMLSGKSFQTGGRFNRFTGRHRTTPPDDQRENLLTSNNAARRL